METFEARRNVEVDECKNFYSYMCGNYAKNVKIPLDANELDAVNERSTEINDKIIEFFEKFDENDARNIRYTKIHAFYKSCTITTTNTIASVAEIRRELKFVGLTLNPIFDYSISRIGISFSKILAHLHATSLGETGFLFKLEVKSYPKNNYRRVIYVGSVSDEILVRMYRYEHVKLGLRYYMSSVTRFLYDYLSISLSPDEKNRFEERVFDVTDFLIDLKKIQEEENVDNEEIQPINAMQLQEIINNELADGEIQLNWVEFLELLYNKLHQSVKSKLESNEKLFLLTNKREFLKTLQRLRRTRIDVFVSAMWWSVVQSVLAKTSSHFESYAELHHGSEYMFRHRDTTRQHKCAGWIRTHFSLFVSHLLASEDKSFDFRAKVEEMVENIKVAFADSLRRASWADHKTRERAQKKLEKLAVNVAFDESIQNPSTIQKAYEKVMISEHSFAITLLDLDKERRKENLLRLFVGDTTLADAEMNLNESEVIVKFDPRKLLMVIPMTVLGFPFYDLGLEAMNYGALGTNIAHLMAHLIDSEGREIDENGEINYWWTPYATKEYQKIMDCYLIIFDTHYVRVAQKCVNGQQTLVENMADSTGFKMSQRAYRKYTKKHGREKHLIQFKHLNHRQLFIMAYSNEHIKKGTSAPNSVRVNGILMNSKKFANLFGCSYQTWMNPQQKCKIWN